MFISCIQKFEISFGERPSLEAQQNRSAPPHRKFSRTAQMMNHFLFVFYIIICVSNPAKISCTFLCQNGTFLSQNGTRDVRRRQSPATFWQRQQSKCRCRSPPVLRRVQDAPCRCSFSTKCDGCMGDYTHISFTRCPMATKPPKATLALRLPPRGRPTYRQVARAPAVHWV